MTDQKKNLLWTYIVLSILISAVCWIVSLTSAQDNGYLVPSAANFLTLLDEGFQNSEHALIALLFAAATFGPFLGAVVATGLESGTVGIKSLFERVRKWRVDRRWYGAILIITGAIALIPSLIAQVLGHRFIRLGIEWRSLYTFFRDYAAKEAQEAPEVASGREKRPLMFTLTRAPSQKCKVAIAVI